jgi:hypothetical protein
MSNSRLSPLALGLACGVFWGVSVFFMGLVAFFFTYGKPFVAAIGTLYIGYDPTILGAFIGGLIGFIDAFIFGLILAWLYNMFNCCSKCKDKDSE